MALLVDAKHHGAIRRVEIEPDDVAHLLNEQRIARQLEGLAAMRLQAKGLPDAMDRRWRMTDSLSHRAQAPMRCPRRSRLQRAPNRLGDLLVANLARSPRPRLVVQPFKTVPRKPLAPLTDRAAEDPQPLGNLSVVAAFRRNQNDPRAQRQRLPRLAPSRQGLKLTPLGCAQHNRRSFSLRHSDLLHYQVRMSRIYRSGH